MMTTPLCTVADCPEPSNPDWHKPWCGHGQAGEHHHYPSKAQGYDTTEDRCVVFICRSCHQNVHEGRLSQAILRAQRDGRPYRYYRLWDLWGDAVCQRTLDTIEEVDTYVSMAPALLSMRERLRVLSDEQLAAWSAQAHERATHAYLEHCLAVYTYRERYSAQAWSEAGVSLFGYAAPTLRRDAALAAKLLARLEVVTPQEAELIMAIPDRQLRVVGRAIDFDAALEEAQVYQAETGRAEPEGLAGRLASVGLLDRPAYRWRCPECGCERPMREFRTEV